MITLCKDCEARLEFGYVEFCIHGVLCTKDSVDACVEQIKACVNLLMA